MTEAARIEVGTRRVRPMLGGLAVADTYAPLLVWEHRGYPTYYFPRADVRAELRHTGATHSVATVGEGLRHDVVLGGRTATGAAVMFPEAPAPLNDAVRFDWAAMDEWLEEDEPVYTHAHDPYKRIDVLASSRHVLVELDGVTVAETRRPQILFETSLPRRYYMPLADVRMALFVPSDHHTRCAYKGEAAYWSVDTGTSVHANIAWIYRTPFPEVMRIAGMVCFFNERVDLTLDGVPQERPHTQFS
ncbi:MAG: DUF427 domain-containing protein [Candidatus Dormibacteraeota bacterium]|nr:DUF427 domain-containing protein [Candidatus Dormibacteraeota bacterium]